MSDQESSNGPPVDNRPPVRGGDDTVSLREQSLRDRESAVSARERAMLSREDAALLREEAVRAHEKGVEAKAQREHLTVQVREVNERLVVATMHAQTMTEEAEKANRLKDEFLAMVAHELRTPLNAVLGWTRMLATGQLKGKRADHAIETIERNASALAHIIDDLLDVSKVTAGTLELVHEPVDLVATTQTALDAVRPLATGKSIQLGFSSDPSCEPVSGDAARLQQVVWNLLSNAIKFTPQGGRVDVSITCSGSIVEVAVADTGQGISPEFLPHVFERFRQGDTTTTRHQGLGLGLAIVRQLVELHEGTVRAESPGLRQGATFKICLPVLTSSVLIERRPPVESRVALPPPRLDGLHVLLVEDHADSREILSMVLEQAGASVTAVSSVKEALQALKARPPDVLVSDIGLPDEDGYTLIRRLRGLEAKHGGFVPAVALTGYVRAEDRAHVLAAGYQVHVPKPVEPVELTAAIAMLKRPARGAPPSDE